MVLVSELDLPVFDPFEPNARDTFPEQLNRDRLAGRWLLKTPLWYSVIENEAVRDLQHDPRLHTWGARLFEIQGVTSGPAYESFVRAILSLEGEEHTRLRRLVSRAFTPRSTDRIRPMMRSFVANHAAPITERGSGDFMAELCNPYPIAVICELVGAPAEDWPKFSQWANDAFKTFNFNLVEDLPVIEEALMTMRQYIEALCEKRRAEPRDDLLSELLVIEEAGDRLSFLELCDLVSTLLLAGTDTTRSQLGVAMMVLADHPEVWDRMVADPSTVNATVEEILRFFPSVGATPRVAAEDVEYRGVTFPAGTMLALSTASANRDPDVVQCPMDFDPSADRGSFSHLTFGSGPHYCLGASLAKAELQEALGVLVRTWRSFELDGEVEIKDNMAIYGPATFPLRVKPL